MADRPDLTAAAATGDRRKALEALRDHLARTLSGAEERSVASLAKQLADVLAQLDDLPVAQEGSTVDELNRRRNERRAAASGQ